MRRQLLSLGIAVGLAAIVALPGAAQATGTPSASPSVSSPAPTTGASPSDPPTGTPSPTGTDTATAKATATATPTKTPTKKPTPTPTPTTTKKPKPKPPKPKPPKHLPGFTVNGPHMYVPGTGNSHYATASTVTVSQVSNVVNQMVEVSWTGFTPSSQSAYQNEVTDYPVMVAECKGLNPTNPNDCYGATNGGSPASFGQYGPSNTAYGTTAGNGTGEADIQLFTQVQNQFLGCNATTPCSLVVVPSQGGDSLDFAKPVCSNHTVDTGGTDLGQYAFSGITSAAFTANGYCSWLKRIVIPLKFSVTPNGCPLRAANFTAGGSPMLADAMQQWQVGMCFGSGSVELQYNGSLNESEARNYFSDGTNDVAFTTQPMPAGPTKHPYVYAPVAVAATSIGYWVDNTNTGAPYTNIKLDARLLVKMLTTSYAYTNDACPGGGGGGFGCDNAVDRNPENLYTDPEFEKLNPSVGQNASQPSGFEIPIVLSGNSDMTWVTTSWIASDPAASGFLAGQFDQWGMHVNTYYLGLKYPINGFLPMDPYFPVSTQYAPVYPLSTLASDMALNQEPGTQDFKDPITGNYDSIPPQVPGDRDMWSVLDTGNAERFLIPQASLENAAGKFVQPTDTAMAAAVKDMTKTSAGTLQMNYTKKDPAAYPLTMVIYAVVPTGGISKAKATAISRFLDFVANQGQQPGTGPGQLPVGYLPLPQSLRQQTLKAATEVLDRIGNPKPAKSPKPTVSPTPTPSKSASPSGSSSAAATAHSIVVSFSQPDATGMSWTVLALLIAGLALLIAGPTALVIGSPGARAAIGASPGRLRHAISSIASHTRGVFRPTRRRNP